MNFIKALWLALVDVFKMYIQLPKLVIELFWCLMGFVSLLLSLVLFPFIVMRKYKELKNEKPKRKAGKFSLRARSV